MSNISVSIITSFCSKIWVFIEQIYWSEIWNEIKQALPTVLVSCAVLNYNRTIWKFNGTLLVSSWNFLEVLSNFFYQAFSFSKLLYQFAYKQIDIRSFRLVSLQLKNWSQSPPCPTITPDKNILLWIFEGKWQNKGQSPLWFSIGNRPCVEITTIPWHLFHRYWADIQTQGVGYE